MWIEILGGDNNGHYADRSLPLRECGLKYGWLSGRDTAYLVTPLAGVWIEIIMHITRIVIIHVTPLAGVWIEMQLYKDLKAIGISSLPLRECGLKFPPASTTR